MTQKYTDEQINTFLELAQDIGIGRAIRQLGFPNSWSTAHRWAENRGVKVAVDELKARAAAHRDWYETNDVLLLAQEGYGRIYEELTSNPDLSAEDQKKLSEAFTKYYNVWANAQGKATNISENRQSDDMDARIADLLNVERAKNLAKKVATSTEQTSAGTDDVSL